MRQEFLKSKADIRIFQILVMSCLFGWGAIVYDFSINWQQVMLTFSAGLISQLFWIRCYNLSYKSLFSAIISCFGIVLLLRANSLWVHPLAAVIAINSKFILQVQKRHFINPSALAIVISLLFLPNTWLSPGQWGATISFGIWITAIGCLLVSRAKMINISWLFIFFYLSGLLIRNSYLGYEIEIFWHSATSGSLLLFTFFMISDPKTAPDHFYGKIILALIVAIVSLLLHYYIFTTNGYIYALVFTSILTPLLNKWKKAKHFTWSQHEHLSNNHSHRPSYI